MNNTDLRTKRFYAEDFQFDVISEIATAYHIHVTYDTRGILAGRWMWLPKFCVHITHGPVHLDHVIVHTCTVDRRMLTRNQPE